MTFCISCLQQCLQVYCISLQTPPIEVPVMYLVSASTLISIPILLFVLVYSTIVFFKAETIFFIISVLQCFFTCTWCRPTCRRRTRFLPEFNHLCWRWEESALWFKPGNTLWIQSNVWVENKTQVTWKYKVISAFEHEVKQRRLFQSTPQPGATVYTLC